MCGRVGSRALVTAWRGLWRAVYRDDVIAVEASGPTGAFVDALPADRGAGLCG